LLYAMGNDGQIGYTGPRSVRRSIIGTLTAHDGTQDKSLA
jgi:hypothetical protein